MAYLYGPRPPSSITRTGTYEPFDLHVSRGQVLAHTPFFRFGFANTIGTTQQTITTAVAAGSAYSYLSAATVLKVSSASANDTAAGTGARTISVSGLDANYAPISETVTLNGQTAVNTTNSFLRVLETKILTVGSGATQAGIIYLGTGTVTTGVPAVVVWRSEVDYNNWSFAGYTVPAGYTAYVTSYTITTQSTTANLNVSAALVLYEYGYTYPEIQSTIRVTSGGNFDRHFDFQLAIPEKSDFELRAWASTGSAVNVTGEIQFVLIKNDMSV
jgi:hypothetical protein